MLHKILAPAAAALVIWAGAGSAAPVTYYVNGSLGTGSLAYAEYDGGFFSGWFSFDTAAGTTLTSPAVTRYALTGYSVGIVGPGASTALIYDLEEQTPGFLFDYGPYFDIGRTSGDVQVLMVENDDVPVTSPVERKTLILRFDLAQLGYSEGTLISSYDELLANFANWGSAGQEGAMSFAVSTDPHSLSGSASLIPAVPLPSGLPLVAGAVGLLALVRRGQRSSTIRRCGMPASSNTGPSAVNPSRS